MHLMCNETDVSSINRLHRSSSSASDRARAASGLADERRETFPRLRFARVTFRHHETASMQPRGSSLLKCSHSGEFDRGSARPSPLMCASAVLLTILTRLAPGFRLQLCKRAAIDWRDRCIVMEAPSGYRGICAWTGDYWCSSLASAALAHGSAADRQLENVTTKFRGADHGDRGRESRGYSLGCDFRERQRTPAVSESLHYNSNVCDSSSKSSATRHVLVRMQPFLTSAVFA